MLHFKWHSLVHREWHFFQDMLEACCGSNTKFAGHEDR